MSDTVQPSVLRFGLLGAAAITPKALIEPARERDDVSLAVVAARDPSRARGFAAEHGVARTAKDYAELVSADDVDVVYNALPVSGHAPWTVRALRAGKHVLCEKPLAMNGAEVRAMLAASNATGARLIEAFHYRFHPAFATYLGWASDPAMGRLRHVYAQFTASIANENGEIRYRQALGGGALMDLGCYPVSWVLETVGLAPLDVQARCALTSTGVDRSFIGQLRFANGATATIDTDMTPGAPRRSRLLARFEHGDIAFDTPITPQDGGALSRRLRGEQELADIDPGTTYAHQLAALVRALRTGERLPVEGPSLLRQQHTLDRLFERAGVGYLRHAMPRRRIS